MNNYFRLMLGKGSRFATQCREGNFIGADFGINQNLQDPPSDKWEDFNQKFIPIFLENRPDKSRIAAGLACGTLWRVSKEIQIGDIVLCPNGSGSYFVGEITSEYFYQEGGLLPHRRTVSWLPQTILRQNMSDALKYSTGSIGTISEITRFADEIDILLQGQIPVQNEFQAVIIQTQSAFEMEKHLEHFLVQNWAMSGFAHEYDIYEDEGERTGQQYATPAGIIDILCESKNKDSLLVIELKRGRASDIVIGQLLRYMGYVKAELAGDSQTVKGVIIALENDDKLNWALSMTSNIEFFRYEINFKLVKA